MTGQHDVDTRPCGCERRMTLTVGSLFAGIGGIDLGLQRAGMHIAWQVENDPYCIKVLEKHWPDVPRHGDIRGVNWHELEPVDVIAGGFPCQPVSVAGKQQGTADERWLWPHMAGAVRHLRPRYVLVENVPGLLANGMGDVLRDLAAIGYDTEWRCISAADMGAPHLRRRIWIVAYPHCDSPRRSVFAQPDSRTDGSRRTPVAGADGPHGHVADAQGGIETDQPEIVDPATLVSSEPRASRRTASGDPPPRTQRRDGTELDSTTDVADAAMFGRNGRAGNQPETHRWPQPEKCSPMWDTDSAPPDTHTSGRGSRHTTSEPSRRPTECPLGRSPHGLPRGMDDLNVWQPGWEHGIPRTLHGQQNRTARLRALGNAVVPQIPELLGRLILAHAAQAPDREAG